MRKIGWLFLIAAIAILVAYRVAAPFTPIWLDAVLLGLSALFLIVVHALAKRREKAKDDKESERSGLTVNSLQKKKSSRRR